MNIAKLPEQPHPMISYLRVGRLLYSSLILFVLESWIYWVQLKHAYLYFSHFFILFWLGLFLFSFVHIYLVLMDGWSRYQDYKRAKDQFYMYGFQPRIARFFIGSKCQRMAAEVAAEELGIENQLKAYYSRKGVKWHHYIPYFMVKEPLFLFKRRFWSRTFLERKYDAKFNFRKLQLKLQT